MPVYEITHPTTGQKIRLEGDGVPSDADIREAFASVAKTQQPQMLSGQAYKDARAKFIQDTAAAPTATKEKLLTAAREGKVAQVSPAELERSRNDFVANEGTPATNARYMLSQSFDPTQPIAPADSAGDWLTRVVPRSMTQLVPKVALGTYQAVKGQTDPIIEAMGSKDPNSSAKMRQQMENNAVNAVKGTGAAMLSGIGFGQDPNGDVTWSTDNAKKAWLSDPALAAAGLAPMVKPAVEAAKPLVNAGRAALSATGDAVSGATSKLSPEALYASSLKMSTGKNLSVPERAARAKTGLEGGYVPTEKGYGRLIDDISDINDQIGNKIQEAKAGGKTVSIDDVVKPLDDIRQRVQYDINPQPLLEKINEIEDNLRNHPLAENGQIPVDAAQKMKIETYRGLKNAYGEMKSGEVEARKAVARGLKEQIVAAVPEIADLNAKDSALINLEKSLGQATKRIANRDVSGIGGPLKMAGGGIIDLAGGHGLGVTAGALLWALDNPTVKANLAIALFKARKAAGKVAEMPRIRAEIGGIVDKLKDQRGLVGSDIDNKPPTTNGKTLYHATDSEFDTFDFSRLGNFTSKNTDSQPAMVMSEIGVWANESPVSKKTGQKIDMPIHMNILHPLKTSFEMLWKRAAKYKTGEDFRNYLIKQGYDGLIVKDSEFGGNSYVAFPPDQIKKASMQKE